MEYYRTCCGISLWLDVNRSPVFGRYEMVFPLRVTSRGLGGIYIEFL